MIQTQRCRTHSECLPTDEQLRAGKEDYYVLGGYEDAGDDPLDDVFLQRLKLPMVVDSEYAGREMTLHDMASVHRWAAAEFFSYEINAL